MEKIVAREWDHWNRSNYRKERIQERIKASQLSQKEQNEQALKKICEIRSRIKSIA